MTFTAMLALSLCSWSPEKQRPSTDLQSHVQLIRISSSSSIYTQFYQVRGFCSNSSQEIVSNQSKSIQKVKEIWKPWHFPKALVQPQQQAQLMSSWLVPCLVQVVAHPQLFQTHQMVPVANPKWPQKSLLTAGRTAAPPLLLSPMCLTDRFHPPAQLQKHNSC